MGLGVSLEGLPESLVGYGEKRAHVGGDDKVGADGLAHRGGNIESIARPFAHTVRARNDAIEDEIGALGVRNFVAVDSSGAQNHLALPKGDLLRSALDASARIIGEFAHEERAGDNVVEA